MIGRQAFGRLAHAIVCSIAVARCGGGSDGGNVAPSITGVRFLTQPNSITAGQPFSVSVELLGADGKRAENASDQVTISASGAAVIGSATLSATTGVATFDGLTITKSSSGLELMASAAKVSVTSATVPVHPASASLQLSSITPAPSNLVLNAATSITFTFKDAFSNPLQGVTVALSTTLTNATFTPPSGTTGASGTFTSSFRPVTPGNAPMSATVNGVPLTFAVPFTVADPCPPATFAFPGTSGGSFPTTTPCVIAGGTGAAFRFTTTSQLGVSLRVSSSFNPTFEVASDPPVDNVSFAPSVTPFTGEWILPTGDHQFRIWPATGVGPYAFTGSVVSANAGCTTRYLVEGGTYTGQSLVSGDCNTDFLVLPSFMDVFELQSTRPCTITMRSTIMDTYLWAFDANTGIKVTENDDDGGGPIGTDAQFSLPACKSPSGPLLIFANTFTGMSGAYTLTVAFTGPPALRAPESIRLAANPMAQVNVANPAGSLTRHVKSRR